MYFLFVSCALSCQLTILTGLIASPTCLEIQKQGSWGSYLNDVSLRQRIILLTLSCHLKLKFIQLQQKMFNLFCPFSLLKSSLLLAPQFHHNRTYPTQSLSSCANRIFLGMSLFLFLLLKFNTLQYPADNFGKQLLHLRLLRSFFFSFSQLHC